MNSHRPPVLKAIISTSKEPEEKNDVHLSLSKIMEEKHTYIYKKLVVPMSMRSIYWKFFGFPATDDGDILTRLKIVCILCKTQIAYNRNTSNLRMHLQNKHSQELMELESSKPSKKDYVAQDAKEKRAAKKLLKATSHIYTTNIDGTVQIDSDLQFVTDPNVSLSNIEDDINIDQPIKVTSKAESSKDNQIAYVMTDDSNLQTSIDEKTVSDAITEFIIIDMQLPEIVEGRGFQRLIATLKSPCEIPSKHKLEEEIIPKVYDTFRESVATNLSCINTEMGLTIEEWKSNSDENFVTISIYYQIPGETTLDTKILSTIHAPLDWGEHQWGSVIDNLLLDWDLRIEKITAVVVATARSEIINALTSRSLTVIPCLLYTLQVCAQACFDNPEVSALLAKCRSIVGIITGNGPAATLIMQEQMMELDESVLMIDYPMVWMSTYGMLEQMVLKKNIINTVIDSIEGVNHECIELNADHWKMIEDIVAVLEPFKVTIMTLSEEKIPIISLLKPLLWQLVSSHLKPKDSDSELARSFKESLSDMLVERYADHSVTLLLQIATSLDPRFKQLPYATDEDKNMASKPIKEMLVKVIEEEGCEPIEIKQENEQPSKKIRLSGMELLLGSLYPTKNSMPAEEKVDLELVQYQSEPTAPLAFCPLQWWAKMSAKCPNLSKLARRYNCVPACCAPPSRISPEAQILYDTRRAALPSHLVDKMLFLHGNHTV
ncbi:zinc finger BED domain-containing protein 1-like [Chelonus insularis]|uniref:zinc finger BED domain-containing protein 1-like n=1 Tax=Chelonus insularis TaxID=460826 RepID=UPI00158848C4|nr:zinc finger BED domain-containing protein 1-like [Chelonus insularis]